MSPSYQQNIYHCAGALSAKLKEGQAAQNPPAPRGMGSGNSDGKRVAPTRPRYSRNRRVISTPRAVRIVKIFSKMPIGPRRDRSGILIAQTERSASVSTVLYNNKYHPVGNFPMIGGRN